MPSGYTEISTEWISRGTNVNAGTLPAMRVVGYATSATYGDAIDALSVVGAAKIKGVTRAAILTAETGDLYIGGTVPIESDGTGTIAVGDKLTVNATNGRVVTAAPGAGVNAEIVGTAESAAAATAGAVVQVRLRRFTMQGA